MCGRFALDEHATDLAGFFMAENDFDDWLPAFSIAPTDPVPIVRERADKTTGEVRRSVDEATWDFHPSFMKDSKRPQFNARIETVATNGLWKGAFASSRCIVPMRGYYEWTERDVDGKTLKIPHFIHGPGELLAAAGIYTARKVGEDWQVSTAIITREARDASGELHDRMPAFLEPEVFDRWLEPTKWDDKQKTDALAMLTEVSSDVAATITTHEVDRKVNNSRTVDPHDASLIEAAASQPGATPGCRCHGGLTRRPWVLPNEDVVADAVPAVRRRDVIINDRHSDLVIRDEAAKACAAADPRFFTHGEDADRGVRAARKVEGHGIERASLANRRQVEALGGVGRNSDLGWREPVGVVFKVG